MVQMRPGRGDSVDPNPATVAGRDGSGNGAGPRARPRRRLASGLLVLGLLVLAAPFAASPALAQTLSVGINSNGTGDATGVEGESLTFTVKMSATRSSNVTLKWRFVAGTARSADYSRDGDGNLTISTGSTSTTFSVDIVDDSRHENAESRPVQLGSGAVLTPGLEICVRHDGGDAETGFGLDLGGGLALARVTFHSTLPTMWTSAAGRS